VKNGFKDVNFIEIPHNIIQVNVKVQINMSLCFLTKHHAMKAYWGSGGIAPHFLDLGTDRDE
jgi:hypothetical protein